MPELIIPNCPLVISSPTGNSELPLVEIDRARVEAPRRRIRPPINQRQGLNCTSFGVQGSNPLTFTAWELCHAAKKTELTRSFTPECVNELALLFAREHSNRFIWDTGNLRCVDNSWMWQEDFSDKAFRGRIGEALAFLTMTKVWGYAYWDRIASFWWRAAKKMNISHAEMVRVANYVEDVEGRPPASQPDFVFEKQNGSVALMEAKGSFAAQGMDHPKVKDTLRKGLNQTGKWAELIAPSPEKSIVIQSILREESDPHIDPSLILHVDPPAGRNPDIKPVEFQRDAIRRGNFGAWLRGMGYQEPGLALSHHRKYDTNEVELPVVNLNGKKFALRIQGWEVDDNDYVRFPCCSIPMLCHPHCYDHLRDFGVSGAYVSGLEVETLNAVSRALREPELEVMMDLPQINSKDNNFAFDLEGSSGSVFPDGSLLGVISSELLNLCETRKFGL